MTPRNVDQPFEYPCIPLTQRSDTPAMRLLAVPVADLMEWAAIPRLSATAKAPQRDKNAAKVRSIQRFFVEDPRNTIPTAVIVALRIPPPDLADDSIRISMEGAQDAWFRNSTDSTEKRPGLVIDGQHRLLGINEFDPRMPVAVVALINPSDSEVAFQFLVINSKASRVGTDHIRALAVEYKEDDLRDRLRRSARLAISAHLNLVEALDTEKDSPFYRLVAWPANREGDQRIVPSALETALSYIQRKLVDFEDLDLLVEFFLAIWRTIKSKWPKQWEASESRLLSKIGIVCMTTYVTDQLIARYDLEDLDISNVEEVASATGQLLSRQREEFWEVPWSSASYDTKAGRQAVVDALVQIARNVRVGAPWSENVPLIAPDSPDTI